MALNPASEPLGHLFPSGDKWRQIHESQLDAWLAAYPRPLVAVPPLPGKAPVRWWRDPTLGVADKADVAVLNKSRRGVSYCQVLTVIPASSSE